MLVRYILRYVTISCLVTTFCILYLYPQHCCCLCLLDVYYIPFAVHLCQSIVGHLFFHCMLYAPQAGLFTVCLFSSVGLSFCPYIFPFLRVGVGVEPMRAKNVPYHLGWYTLAASCFVSLVATPCSTALQRHLPIG